MRNTRKILSIVLAMCIVSAAVGGVMVTDQPEEEESDAIAITLTMVAVGAVIFGLGAAAGHLVTKWLTPTTDPLTEYAQKVEAASVIDGVNIGVTNTNTALQNYAQIWELTSEHWVRQAELTSSFRWSADGDYDSNAMLLSSGIYSNSSHMLVNSAAQINEHFSSLGERLSSWNGIAAYANHMAMEWVYGGNTESSKSTVSGSLGVAVSVASESNDRVYLSAEPIWVSGSTAVTIRSVDGATLSLNSGWTDLDAVTGFVPGIYELPAGRSYCSSGILPISGVQAAAPTAGLVFSAGSSSKLATWSDSTSKVLIDGQSYNDISLRVHPDEGESAIGAVTGLLSNYFDMILAVEGTMLDANVAATTVWNIYDKAGNASSYLTTLTVPNIYDNMEISQAQQEIITILAMEQLSQYYSSHAGQIKTGDYTISEGSLQLFCRGDIKDSTGTTVYSNVIFTPFFYSQAATINNGANALGQESIVAIWSTTESTLSGWNGSADINSTDLITVPSGWELYVYEMTYDGTPSSTVNLTQKDISIIEPGEIDPTPLPEPPASSRAVDWVQIVIIILGTLAVAVGAYMRRIDYILIGAVCIAAGILVVPMITGWLG